MTVLQQVLQQVGTLLREEHPLQALYSK